MRFVKGCLGAIAGLFLLAVLFLVVLSMNYSYGWFDQETTQPVQSPDGTCSAYMGMRGMMDNARCRLYIKKNGERAQRVMDLYSGELKWSEDSSRVAIVRLPDGIVWIYDVKTGKSGQADVEFASKKQPAAWRWTESGSIEFTTAAPGSGDEQMLSRWKIVDNGPSLAIVEQKRKGSGSASTQQGRPVR